jgi:hypothetical protein
VVGDEPSIQVVVRIDHGRVVCQANRPFKLLSELHSSYDFDAKVFKMRSQEFDIDLKAKPCPILLQRPQSTM